MKNWITKLLVIEIQVLLVLLVITLVKIKQLNDKVYNTNRFVYEVMKDSRISELNTIHDDDIVIGEPDSPVTIFLYSRFDCSACNEFLTNNYGRLKEDFLDPGMAKLVIRYLTHQSKPHTLFAAKCAYYAYYSGHFDDYIEKLDSIYPVLDTNEVKLISLNITHEHEALNEFIRNDVLEEYILELANDTRNAGIRYTPTVFINNRQLMGNRTYKKLNEVIISELENVLCE